MASIFGGLGSALGSAASGYLSGENKGEAEAYRRSQIDEANALRLLLAQQKVRPTKEDVPFELQALIDTEARIMGPTASAQERNQWEQGGWGAVTRGVKGVLAQHGPQAAREALAIFQNPEGTDSSAAMAAFQKKWGGAAARPTPALGGLGPAPKAAESVDQFLAQPRAPEQPQQPTGPRPLLKPDFQYKDPLEEERINNMRSQARERESTRPRRMEWLQRQIDASLHSDNLEDKTFNFNLVKTQYEQDWERWKGLVAAGQKDYQLMTGYAADLIAAARQMERGAQTDPALRQLMVLKGPLGGAEVINESAAILALQKSGRYSPEEIQAIVSGAQGAVMGNGRAVGGSPPPGGGPPGLPPIAGAPGAPGGAAGGISFSNAREAANWAAGQGWKVTSIDTGKHNPGSAHYENRAFDLRTRDVPEDRIQQFIREAPSKGLKVVDERQQPPGQKVWSGPHLHVEVLPQGSSYPGAGPDATTAGLPTAGQPAPASSLNTIAPSPPLKNPYDPTGNPFRAWVFDKYTGAGPDQAQTVAGELLRQFRGKKVNGVDYERIISEVVGNVNSMQRSNALPGVPAPDTHGAEVPNRPNYGALKIESQPYADTGTSPYVVNAGAEGPNVAVEPGGVDPYGVTDQMAGNPPPYDPGQLAGAYREDNTILSGRMGGAPPQKEKAVPLVGLSVPAPPAIDIGGPRMGPPGKKQGDLGKAWASPSRAAAEAGTQLGIKAAVEGVGSLVSPREGSPLSRIIQVVREHLGPTGAEQVPGHRSTATIWDDPRLAQSKDLQHWNTIFKPWAQEMGYQTPEALLEASKWFLTLQDKLQRPPYRVRGDEMAAQLQMILQNAKGSRDKNFKVQVRAGKELNLRNETQRTPAEKKTSR